MKQHLLVLPLLIAVAACAGGAGHAAAVDGPPPSGKSAERGLELVEGDAPAEPQVAPPSDGTTTPEIVNSVEKDRP
jgi:hypothetical protein